MSSNRYTAIPDSINGKLNRELLDKKRDLVIDDKAISQAFDDVRFYIVNDDLRWIDTLHYLKSTLDELRLIGCNVNELTKQFKQGLKEFKLNEK